MHKALFGLLPLLLIPLLVVSINAQIDTNTESLIPSWIKVVAGAWANDEITDSEYKDAQEFLIENGIFKVDRVSTVPVVQEINVESEKDKEIKHLKNELQKLDTKQHELEKTHMEYRDHYEAYADHETKDWYQQEMEKLQLKWSDELSLKRQLETRNEGLEEENKNTADGVNEAHNKIIELEEKITELKTKVIQLELQSKK